MTAARAAFTTLNAGVGGDTITFAAGVTGTITLTSGTLSLANNVTITGPGAAVLAISGNNAIRVLNVNIGVTAAISGVTITKGSAPSGGGIFNSGGTVAVTNSTFSGNTVSNANSASGGGMYNAGGTVTITNSTFSGNTANASGFIASSGGGGIFNSGTLAVTNSTFSGNIVSNIGSVTNSGGGGILNNSSGAVTVTNSTFSGNIVNSNSGLVTQSGGGGIFNNVGTLTVTNSTLAGNASNTGGGGIFTVGLVGVVNTIIAANSGSSNADVIGPFTSGGHNLIGDATGSLGFTNGVSGDQVGTAAVPLNPLLGALQFNGSPTQTRLLLPGSPAIGAGDPVVCARPLPPAAPPNGAGGGDGRGFPRLRSVCDSGAYEGGKSLDLTAPATATAGSPAAVPVRVQDNYGNFIGPYAGTVHLTSSDTRLTPPDYQFTTGFGGDNGLHTFALTFGAAGVHTLTVTDTLTPALTDTQATITVAPAVAAIGPASGSTDGGGVVTISGAGFAAGGTSVTFGGFPAMVTNVSSDGTLLTLTPPPHMAGAVAVQVRVNGIAAATAPMYTYGTISAAPTPLRASPVPTATTTPRPQPTPLRTAAPPAGAGTPTPLPAPTRRMG